MNSVADHVRRFITVHPSSDGCFQQDNVSCHRAQIRSDWFTEHDSEVAVLKWPPRSPDLNPIPHLWDVVKRKIHITDVPPTRLQQPSDVTSTKTSDLRGTPAGPCRIHVERIKADQKGKKVVKPITVKYGIYWKCAARGFCILNKWTDWLSIKAERREALKRTRGELVCDDGRGRFGGGADEWLK